jgi:hypothetical protein
VFFSDRVYRDLSEILPVFSIQMKVSSTVEDWTYTMRRTMQEIIPGLYLGKYRYRKVLALWQAGPVPHLNKKSNPDPQ